MLSYLFSLLKRFLWGLSFKSYLVQFMLFPLCRGDKKKVSPNTNIMFDMCDIRVAQSLVWQRLKTRTATVEAAFAPPCSASRLPASFPVHTENNTSSSTVSSASWISSAWIAVATRKSCFSCNLWSCVRERCDKIPLLGNASDQHQQHGFCHHRWLIK